MCKEVTNGLRKGTKLFGSCLGSLVNAVVLSIAYFFGIGLSFLIARLSGKSLMEIKTTKKKGSYWNNVNFDNSEDGLYRQF